MRHARRTIWTAAAAWMAAGAAVGFSPWAPGALAQQAGQPAPAREEKPRLISVEFTGGAAKDYIRAVREAARPAIVNVIVPEPEVLQIWMGPITLQEVSPETAMHALEWALAPRHAVKVQLIGENTFGVLADPPLHEMQARRMAAAPTEDARMEVISLRDLVEPRPEDAELQVRTLPVEVVLSAARAAVEAAPDAGARAELKYHEDSGLLLVRGTPRQASAAMHAIKEIRDDLTARRNAARAAAMRDINLDELRMEVELADARERLLEVSVSRAHDALAKAELLLKEGMATTEEVDAARAARERMKAELENARLARGLAQARLRAAERRVAKAAVQLPEGRSSVIHDLRFLGGARLEKASAAATALAELAGDEKPLVSLHKDGMMLVTADRAAQEAIAGALRGLASARNATIEPPRVREEKKGEEAGR